MKLSSQVKPISYLKANAAEVLDALAENQQPMIITQNGEAKAVLQDLASYEKTQETLALLKIIALGDAQIARGEIVPARQAIEALRTDLKSSAADTSKKNHP
ncbi:type II toxin-antitoxin system Phd/YefM family antitoxin [Dongia rigui]|uniref:Antitoxin n=1 Tax=Dongia rigui TaxID=940149 RepID=A0ABU5DVJ4_9PROT|nr:type II toxin-antitoxin system Phd/YefM family antitoxin [Dongia rigui]MDY0871320.1 type II toxin-antitoxin system Phd/YefM family antitoxin [Dongia rigui]